MNNNSTSDPLNWDENDPIPEEVATDANSLIKVSILLWRINIWDVSILLSVVFLI